MTAPPPPRRIDGYAPLRDYAAIGDGRTVALVARDGTIDWLAFPELDSPTAFAAVLDARCGGRFALAPDEPFAVSRRYLPQTNVLETTFRADRGEVRVIDALTVPDGRLGPARELQRRIEGVAGRVAMSWRVEPRFSYGARSGRTARRAGVPVVSAGASAMAVRSFDAGEPGVGADAIEGRFEARAGTRATLALCLAHQEPLVLPTRAELDARLDGTIGRWRDWAAGRRYEGRWRDAVLRSILALKLLVFAPSGAVAAAATTSLPEAIGGERNWDYRFSWVRDSAFTLGAFLRLGCAPEARAYFWWLMHASQLTRPRLNVLYRLDGGARAPERERPLAGYRGSRPVRTGNGAAEQLQLDTYGELLHTAWLHARAAGGLDADIASRLARIADHVCDVWRRPDAGIWEVRSAPRHFTQSKMMCWIALDRALDLADRGELPSGRRARWRRERDAIGDLVERCCVAPASGAYARAAGSGELDAGVLLGLLLGYGDPASGRWVGTVEAIRRELGHGPYVRRYSGEDGLTGREGAFLACSFWLAEALATIGRPAQAAALMDELVALANDVGLYAEEVDAEDGAFLGNMPQGLSHLALISAACAIDGCAP